MKFLHSDFRIGPDDVVLVRLDAQANVLLLDESNFSAYKQGKSFNYYGGWATRSPVHLKPPHNGHWHVVVDMGNRAGSVRAGISLMRRG